MSRNNQRPNKAKPGTNCRWVVKVGSALVTKGGQGLDAAALASWAAQIAQLQASGIEVVLVSSGAIAEGVKRLGWPKRPTEMNALQAAAAVGQMGLVHAYQQAFEAHSTTCAQVLLTHADLANRERYLNARQALLTLLAHGVVPIVNENDTVVTDEIRFGDNDTLGALVANLLDAEVLVILTDQAGLYSADPRKNPDAELIQVATAGSPSLERMAGGAGTCVGTGGMLTKVRAAKRAARSGASTIIASGHEPEVLVRLAQGHRIGTLLKPKLERLAARKQWMADHLKTQGALWLDAGAAKALQTKGGSLLPVGITHAAGRFLRGEVVSCLNPEGQEIARGLVNYDSVEVNQIAGKPSKAISGILGHCTAPEVIHRDNLVVL